jgi:hypothetical protein
MTALGSVQRCSRQSLSSKPRARTRHFTWAGRASRRLLALGVVATLGAACTSVGQSPTSTTTTTGAARASSLGGLVADVTPAGWAPVDDGDAQLSVPSDWFLDGASGATCGPAAGVVFVGEPSRKLPSSMGCPPWGRNVTVVAMFPFKGGPLQYLHQRRRLVNHIPVFGALSASSAHKVSPLLKYFVPNLGEEVTASGPLASKVLGTLTRSPLAVVLANDGRPTIPSGWQKVSFEGVTFRVPPGWLINRRWWPWCTFGVVRRAVALGKFDNAPPGAPYCPGRLETAGAEAGRDGVLAAVGKYAPLIRTPTDHCFAFSGLSACITATSGTSIGLAVTMLHRPRVYVEIGLAGNGLVARTILYSLRQ